MLHQHQVKKEQEYQKMVKIATSKEAKKVYEAAMKQRDPKALTKDGIIKSYKVNTNTLKYNPMGGMEITLTINNNKELGFQIGIVKNEQGKLESSGYVIYPKLVKLLEE